MGRYPSKVEWKQDIVLDGNPIRGGGSNDRRGGGKKGILIQRRQCLTHEGTKKNEEMDER